MICTTARHSPASAVTTFVGERVLICRRHVASVERQLRGKQDILGSTTSSQGSSITDLQRDSLQLNLKTHLQGVVVFFPGDQLEHAIAAPEIRRLQDPKIQAQLMATKFPGCSSVVCACPLRLHLPDTHTHTVSSLLVCLARVMPSRLEGSYACYDHFLEGFTRSGEPLGYPAGQLKVTLKCLANFCAAATE